MLHFEHQYSEDQTWFQETRLGASKCINALNVYYYFFLGHLLLNMGIICHKIKTKNWVHSKLWDRVDLTQKPKTKIFPSVALICVAEFYHHFLLLFPLLFMGAFLLQPYRISFLSTLSHISSPKSFYPLFIPISLPFPFFQLSYSSLSRVPTRTGIIWWEVGSWKSQTYLSANTHDTHLSSSYPHY